MITRLDGLLFAAAGCLVIMACFDGVAGEWAGFAVLMGLAAMMVGAWFLKHKRRQKRQGG